MLRTTRHALVKSHQLKKSQHPDAGSRYGRNYNRGMIKYGFTGFGISTYSSKKDRSFKPRPMPGTHQDMTEVNHLAATTKSLSPHWRSFALNDGGVLFSHPSHKQVMTWNQDTLQKEAEATGMTSTDQWVNSRIQAIIAENTIENVSLSHWRKRHMWALIKQQGRIQKHFGVASYVKGIRGNIHGKGTT